ncbi:unnamed protein product, partial [Amoebophrya sp. A25]
PINSVKRSVSSPVSGNHSKKTGPSSSSSSTYFHKRYRDRPTSARASAYKTGSSGAKYMV